MQIFEHRKVSFLQIYLHMSKKSSNFAGEKVLEEHYDSTK